MVQSFSEKVLQASRTKTQQLERQAEVSAKLNYSHFKGAMKGVFPGRAAQCLIHSFAIQKTTDLCVLCIILPNNVFLDDPREGI